MNRVRFEVMLDDFCTGGSVAGGVNSYGGSGKGHRVKPEARRFDSVPVLPSNVKCV